MSSLPKSRLTLFDAEAPVAAAGFLDETPALALDAGAVLLIAPAGRRRAAAHPGGTILASAAAGDQFITGGDDGRVAATSAKGELREIADEKGQWIDALAARKDGAIAWSSGKTVRARDPAGRIRSFSAPSSVRGLAFMPKGYRLAIAHYGGASLWFPNATVLPDRFEWKGSHLSISVSPDGRFLVTAMQEQALHAWRVEDKKDMRMTGYPSKTHSLSWSFDSLWLATSGAGAGIIWPFKDKEGPAGRAPLERGMRQAKVTCVAFHPKAHALAQGYEDGAVVLCRIPDGSELLVRAEPSPAGAITALAWDGPGNRLLFGATDGAAGIFELAG